MRSRPLLLAAALFTATPALLPARDAHAEIVDRVVAVVEDDAIFLSDVERRVRPFERELETINNPRERAQRRETFFRETLERMVDDALIRRAAQRAHVTVADSDVDRMIEGIARQRGATVDVLYQALAQAGIARSEYRTFMETEVLRLRVLNSRVRGRIHISEADIAEEYRRRSRLAQDHVPFHAAHIFLAFPEHPTAAQIAEVQQRASDVADRARGGEDFAVLARTTSDDADTREHGGDLPTFDPADENAAPPAWVTTACRDLQPGGISVPVRGENGYHVFRLITRQAVEVPALQQVRTELFNELLNREMTRHQRIYLRELRRQSSVDVRL